MDRQLDLIFRLFCTGQLFESVRPFLLRSVAHSLETEGVGEALSTWAAGSPPARWLVYLMCLCVVVLGPRRALICGLAAAQVLDVGAAIWGNALSSGYAEKGILVVLSVGAAGLLLVDEGGRAERAARMRSFLRAAAGVGFAAVALNKTNADFLDPIASCSKVLSQELVTRIPFLEAVGGPLSSSAWMALGAEVLLLPLLLVSPRHGALYTWAFFAGIATVGPRATCFVFMAMSLSFLPATDFARLRLGSRPVLWGTVLSFASSMLFWVMALDESRRFAATQLISRVGFLALALVGIGLLVLNAWRSGQRGERGETGERAEHRPSAFRSGPRIAAFVAAGALALLLVNELSPYLGLKTKYSLTMWSNLRTDSGRSNSYVFPEALRISSRVDRAFLLVTRVSRSAPVEAPRASAPRAGQGLGPFVASHTTAMTRLRQAEARHGPIRFVLFYDGKRHMFDGTGPESEFASFIEKTRPRVDWFDQRVMTLGRPQRCLGP